MSDHLYAVLMGPAPWLVFLAVGFSLVAWWERRQGRDDDYRVWQEQKNARAALERINERAGRP